MQARLLKFTRPESRDPKGASPSRGSRLSALEREFLPHLLEIEETPPPREQRLVLWGIAACLTLALAWAIVSKTDVIAIAPGKFIPDGRVKVIQPMETSVVKAILVHEGQHVAKGDLLIELDPALSEADFASATELYEQSRLEQARLVAELKGGQPSYGEKASREAVALQEALREARVATYQMKLAAAKAAVDERRSAVGAAEAQLKKAQVTLQISAEREQRTASLLHANFLSRMEYLKTLQEFEGAKQDLAAQEETVEQQRHSLQQALKQYDVVTQDWKSSVLTDLNRNVESKPALKRDEEKAHRINELKTLRAPVGGYVQTLGVTTLGGVVTPAQSLVTIVPDDTPLLIEATLSNDDIGYVHVGQEVDIKVDTYPFQKYGILAGKLAWISPDAETTQRQDASASGAVTDPSGDRSNKGTFVYRVHIRPNPNSELAISSGEARLQPGMTVQADIRTDRRRLIEFLLSPVVKYLDEGMKVR